VSQTRPGCLNASKSGSCRKAPAAPLEYKALDGIETQLGQMRITKETRGRAIKSLCSSMGWQMVAINGMVVCGNPNQRTCEERTPNETLRWASYTSRLLHPWHFAIPLRAQEYVPRQFICTVSSLQAITSMPRCLFNLFSLSAHYDI
jgi:hypothetical protein